MRTMLQNTRLQHEKVPSQFGLFIRFSVGTKAEAILRFFRVGPRFRIVSPLVRQTLQFWFSLNLRDRVEADGEVVWLDSTTESGRPSVS